MGDERTVHLNRRWWLHRHGVQGGAGQEVCLSSDEMAQCGAAPGHRGEIERER
jgi:hypothetical protein